MTPTPSDTIRNCLAFAFEAADTNEDRAWVNEGQEALAMMEGEMERLRKTLGPFSEAAAELFAEGTGYSNGVQKQARVVNDFGSVVVNLDPEDFRRAHDALAQPGDIA